MLLILIGALGATVLVMRAGNRISAIEITERVAAGEKIPDSAIREVMVADGSGINYVAWADRSLLGRYRAATDIVDGSVLVGHMLSSEDVQIKEGKAVIGLSLKGGQFPDGLKIGDTVAVYRVGNDATKSSTGNSGNSGNSGGGANTLLANNAKIKAVPGGNGDALGSSGNAYSIVVDQSVAGPLTLAASAGEVSLVLVPASKG
ncbi:hypothetical protein [Streptomyces sp. SPB162]|uniref:hypothetical protein n=1 Tax=Streptomyces sp. SPB162 TaxID=2940560 RepID=UPI002404FA5A|nr:hypothetical protein [Streptomyces sp. SPB162]MDF9813824.1 hypothetical protein [Streptomyces sp. SPB162]